MKATPIPAWLQIILAFMVAGGVTYLVMKTKRDTPLTLQQLEQMQQQQEQQQKVLEQMRPMLDSLYSWKMAEDSALLRKLQTEQSNNAQIKQQYEAISKRYDRYTSDSIIRAFSKIK